MNKDLRFLLIYPPCQFHPQDAAKPDGSLGLLYIAGALRDAGYEVSLLDATLEGFDRREELPNGMIRVGMSKWGIAFRCKDYDVIGITNNFTQQMPMALNLIRFLHQEYPDKKVIVGGISARNNRSMFYHSGASEVFLSEAEKGIVEPLNKLEDNLDNLPFPAWDLLPLQRYWELARPHGGKFRGPYASMMTSRGCVNSCSFCHISKEGADSISGNIGKYRTKSVERVGKEIDILKGLGVQHIFVEDDCFLVNRKRSMAILERFKQSHLSFSAVNGVNIKPLFNGDGPDFDLIDLMAETGFKELSLPFESGSQRILDKYNSGKLNLEKMNTTLLIKACKNAGLTIGGNYLFGFPDETYEEMTETIMLAKKHMDAGMDRANLMIVVPFPGTKLYDMAIEGGYLSPDHDPSQFNWLYPTMKNTVIHPEVLKYVNKIAWKLLNQSWRIDNINSMTIGGKG